MIFVKLKSHLFIFLLLIMFSPNTIAHDMYLSLCQIIYNPGEKCFDISFKVFKDDLQKALSAEGAPELNIGQLGESPEAVRYIYNYLKKHFALSVNNMEVSYSYVNRELKDNDKQAIWINLKTAPVEYPQSLEIKNDILVDVINSQYNVIQAKISEGKTGYLMLDIHKRSGKILF